MKSFEGYLDERDAQRAAAEHQTNRYGAGENESPEALVDALLGEISRRFYRKEDGERWLKHQPALKLALTWQAGWLKQRAITIPLPAYRATMMEIIEGIAQHGDTKKIGYFPAYFMHCTQQWFAHNGEDLYQRQKRVRNAMDLSFLKGRPVTAAAAPDPIEALAAAHRVLAGKKRPVKSAAADDDQLSLL